MFSYGNCFLRKWDLNWTHEKDDMLKLVHIWFGFQAMLLPLLFFKNCCMSFGTQPWHAIKWHKRISKGHLILKDISWKDMYTLCNNKHSTFLPKPTLPSSLRPVNSVPGEQVLNADFNICHPPWTEFVQAKFKGENILVNATLTSKVNRIVLSL